MEVREPDRGQVDEALDADVTAPPFREEFPVERVEALELEDVVGEQEPTSHDPPDGRRHPFRSQEIRQRAELRESSLAPISRAQASVSTTRNSVRPFGALGQRRIALNDPPPPLPACSEGARWRKPPSRPSASSARASMVPGMCRSSIAIEKPRSGSPRRHEAERSSSSASSPGAASAAATMRHE